jgi:DNA-binding response OmpR family regulator
MANDACNSQHDGSGAKTLMVVDADILGRTAIADYLRGCGYRVIEGASADEVRVVLDAGHEIEVLLIDLQITGTEDAFSLARDLRNTRRDIDVILTSSDAKLAEKATDLCEHGPMIKPYEQQELTRRISMMRERRRSGEALELVPAAEYDL